MIPQLRMFSRRLHVSCATSCNFTWISATGSPARRPFHQLWKSPDFRVRRWYITLPIMANWQHSSTRNNYCFSHSFELVYMFSTNISPTAASTFSSIRCTAFTPSQRSRLLCLRDLHAPFSNTRIPVADMEGTPSPYLDMGNKMVHFRGQHKPARPLYLGSSDFSRRKHVRSHPRMSQCLFWEPYGSPESSRSRIRIYMIGDEALRACTAG